MVGLGLRDVFFNMLRHIILTCNLLLSLTQVVPGIVRINEDSVEFMDATERKFAAIVFATGYKRSANNWLKVRSLF